jgi:hypothetical protein
MELRRLRYGIHFWWLHNGVGPGSFSFESLRSLQTAFASQVDYLRVARHPLGMSSHVVLSWAGKYFTHNAIAAFDHEGERIFACAPTPSNDHYRTIG